MSRTEIILEVATELAEEKEKIEHCGTEFTTNELIDFFVLGAKYSDEHPNIDAFIEKACEWLSKHFYDEEYQSMDNEGVWIYADGLINDFKNYMKGE